VALVYAIKKLEIELPWAECKNKCKFCSNYGGRTADTPMSKEEVFGIVDDFAQMGGETLVLSGGEPLENPFVYDLIGHSKRKLAQLQVYTSGYLLNGENVTKLRSLHVDTLYITINGNETTHDFLTDSAGSYRRSTLGLKRAAEEGIRVSVSFIPMKVNWREWKLVLQTANELGAKELRFIDFMPQGRGWDNRAILEPSPKEYQMFLEELASDLPDLMHSTNIEVSSSGNFAFLIDDESFPLPTCSAGRTGLTITPDGYIIPCLGCRTEPGSMKPAKEYVLGRYRLSPENFLDRVWRTSIVLNRFRDQTPNKLLGKCRNCLDLPKCKGGCPIRRKMQSGDMMTGPDNRCIIGLIRPVQ
jgi:radical SAM protein with 4Fe4S-binding SPASM domain